MLRLTPIVANADNIVNCGLLASCPSQDHLSTLGKFFHSRQNMRHFQHRFSVDVSMRKTEGLSKLANIKKDARLTIRIPRELKAKIEGIDRVYGVALPKIANECLRSFCAYVEQKKQTPTFPLCINPHSPDDRTPNHASVRRRRGRQNGQRQRI
jgi:hypothetical protein